MPLASNEKAFIDEHVGVTIRYFQLNHIWTWQVRITFHDVGEDETYYLYYRNFTKRADATGHINQICALMESIHDA